MEAPHANSNSTASAPESPAIAAADDATTKSCIRRSNTTTSIRRSVTFQDNDTVYYMVATLKASNTTNTTLRCKMSHSEANSSVLARDKLEEVEATRKYFYKNLSPNASTASVNNFLENLRGNIQVHEEKDIPDLLFALVKTLTFEPREEPTGNFMVQALKRRKWNSKTRRFKQLLRSVSFGRIEKLTLKNAIRTLLEKLEPLWEIELAQRRLAAQQLQRAAEHRDRIEAMASDSTDERLSSHSGSDNLENADGNAVVIANMREIDHSHNSFENHRKVEGESGRNGDGSNNNVVESKSEDIGDNI